MPSFTKPFLLLSLPLLTTAITRSVTPHELYSSSIGILGCKIDTNRVAYFPEAPTCNNLCVRITHQGRSLELLRIDQSGGANDISYDAWNFLSTGSSAIDEPTVGGGIEMEVEDIPAENCRSLLKENVLPFSAPNSMNFIASCLSQPDSFVARNHKLFNIQDSNCQCGFDEVCSLDLNVSNQPSCPHQLGTSGGKVLPATVFNIEFGTGKKVAGGGLTAC
ncbi:hypothetical protein QBC38DRAFT_536578 [Podospora fimiseda]|uniref:Uncharacterized protein n=1 Tax=Podospora fimiseda TaxID=252190 RepID=A0AAN7GYS4_9PEZI|nr:hypothetical protein QBC38DRAFT_536578 [Podospora fimiseda]